MEMQKVKPPPPMGTATTTCYETHCPWWFTTTSKYRIKIYPCVLATRSSVALLHTDIQKQKTAIKPVATWGCLFDGGAVIGLFVSLRRAVSVNCWQLLKELQRCNAALFAKTLSQLFVCTSVCRLSVSYSSPEADGAILQQQLLYAEDSKQNPS